MLAKRSPCKIPTGSESRPKGVKHRILAGIIDVCAALQDLPLSLSDLYPGQRALVVLLRRCPFLPRFSQCQFAAEADGACRFLPESFLAKFGSKSQRPSMGHCVALPPFLAR